MDFCVPEFWAKEMLMAREEAMAFATVSPYAQGSSNTLLKYLQDRYDLLQIDQEQQMHTHGSIFKITGKCPCGCGFQQHAFHVFDLGIEAIERYVRQALGHTQRCRDCGYPIAFTNRDFQYNRQMAYRDDKAVMYQTATGVAIEQERMAEQQRKYQEEMSALINKAMDVHFDEVYKMGIFEEKEEEKQLYTYDGEKIEKYEEQEVDSKEKYRRQAKLHNYLKRRRNGNSEKSTCKGGQKRQTNQIPRIGYCPVPS
jgi:putative ubiquitin-RnfH superfamily antitoxin RatB of RatAB toxin-antitoxin module